MKWLVADSLSTPEQFFASHLDSYTHYLREYGEDATEYCLSHGRIGDRVYEGARWSELDVVFALDQYDRCAGFPARLHVAQVAAICNPMPWEVRKPDGTPAYNIVISSIPWMVEEARKHGCRAGYQPLAFDHRALVCAAPKKDIDVLFVGSVDGNHQKRAAVLHELRDMVQISPPCYGRGYHHLVSRAKVLVHVGAEWANGSANALRLFEGGGLSTNVVSDGRWDGPGRAWWTTVFDNDWKHAVRMALHHYDYLPQSVANNTGLVLSEHGYHRRIPQLVDWVKGL